MTLQGTGIGLRRAHLGPLAETVPETIDFLEAAPENWIGIGGRQARQFRAATAGRPLVCHGLSLSIGGPAPLDEDLVGAIGRFMDHHDAVLYSEHLSYRRRWSPVRPAADPVHRGVGGARGGARASRTGDPRAPHGA